LPDDLEAGMTDLTSRQGSERRRRDDGSVLTMVLALMVVGSLAVFALLNLATVLFMNRPPIEVRDRTFWSAKSAVSMAMVMQASHGPNGCYDPYRTETLNGFTATVSCTAQPAFTSGRDRYAIVTTSNVPSARPLRGQGPGAIIKPISGNVFLNAGLIDDTSRDLSVTGGVTLSSYTSPQTPVARYLDYTTPVPPAAPVAAPCIAPAITSPADATAPTSQTAIMLAGSVPPVCEIDPTKSWMSYVGDSEVAGGARSYPALPPLPPYTRPSVNQASLSSGSCKLYFPGQYLAPLTLGPGDHYFASGIYYFTGLVTLQPGARVVGGEGKFSGCAVDAEAVFATDAPKAHSVTGKGATFVFGGAGRLIANDAALRMNLRISDTTSRGSEATSFRSVNFRTTAPPATPADLEIPSDLVIIADAHDSANPACSASVAGQPCLQPASAYVSKASRDASERRYTASTLGVNDTIVSITQTGGNWASNRLELDGYTFVPNSRVLLNGGNNTDYRLSITGGVVASSIELQYNQLPAISGNWFLGVRERNLEQRFDFYANVDGGNGMRTVSRATLQVDEDGNYAINGWTVDPNAAGSPPPPPPSTTTTTLPPPPSTTSTTTTTTTTTLPPTTTTTLPPVIPPTPADGNNVAACRLSANPNGWNRDFGPGTWAAEFWNWPSTLPGAFGSDPFPGTAAATTTVTHIDACGDTVPFTGVQKDRFTARFTRTFTTAEPRTTTFLAGGDDGYRVYLNGTKIIDNWSVHSHQWRTWTGNVPAGNNTIVFEYYENGGSNTYQFWKN
jgi:hypothetical protein